ncbi:BON domain-containing protein [Paraburkholderia sp. Ac-20340]|uniref:BON domain-containing protein n=1 Tax=Paraburkholderia sp. Ac-20340 TaxID=2703888 RepID=UPI00197FA06E|nr:BON domain-containing protein [Paraburkholderia sp. Ac-20340]MBN3853733.1 BON domain-containing protein [Paraburkholderia sp. Ac-20340]
MNRFQAGRFGLAALVLALGGVSAQAQTPAPDADQAAASAVPAMSAKEAKAANRKLQKDVVRVLARTKGLVSTAITVRANNGDVVLEGAVPEQTQMALAAKAAEGVAGVKSVKNMLTLSQF